MCDSLSATSLSGFFVRISAESLRTFDDCHEGFGHFCGVVHEGRGFHEEEVVPLGEVASFVRLDLSEFVEVGFVSDEHDDCVVQTEVVFEFLDPVLDVVKRFSVGDVVGDDRSVRSVVVGRREGFISLLSSRVPDLYFDLALADLDGLGEEVHSDGRLALDAELVADEPSEQVGLADRRVC